MKNLTSVLLMCLLSIAASFAQPGTLDSTFSKDGKVKTQVATQSEITKSAGHSVAIQADGKIVVAGYAYSGSFNFGLVRYKQDGQPDSAFGTNGKVTTDFHLSPDQGQSVAIQADGKILVVGYTYGSNSDFALVRYNYNGKIDSSFGKKGKVITDFGGNEYGYTVAIQPDGKIVMAGHSGLYPNTDFALVRYMPDGNLDNSFGKNGKVINDVGGGDYIFSVAIQPDGKILAAGYTGNDPAYDFALVRYMPNGKTDSAFGTGGKVIADFGSGDYGRSVAIQADGKIVEAGYAYNGSAYDFALVRYRYDGKPDSAFGTNGKVLTNFSGSSDYGYSVVMQPDGKIVVAGFISNELDRDFALARYKPNGQPDKTFGSNGIVITDFGNNDDYGQSVAIQADGKIVVAGQSGFKFAVARYNGDNTSLANNTNNNFSNLQKQNNTSSTIHLSPNPVKDMLHIEDLSSSTKIISVIDAKGKLLQQTVTANSSYSFSVKQFAAGIYFIRIDEGDKISLLKFIKE